MDLTNYFLYRAPYEDQQFDKVKVGTQIKRAWRFIKAQAQPGDKCRLRSSAQYQYWHGVPREAASLGLLLRA